MSNTDERFSYHANGKQVGIRWELYGGLPSPEHPVVDTQSGNTMDKGVQ